MADSMLVRPIQPTDRVYQAARTAGVKRVYWQMQDSNAAGRLLYDKVATHAGFIVYGRELPG